MVKKKSKLMICAPKWPMSSSLNSYKNTFFSSMQSAPRRQVNKDFSHLQIVSLLHHFFFCSQKNFFINFPHCVDNCHCQKEICTHTSNSLFQPFRPLIPSSECLMVDQQMPEMLPKVLEMWKRARKYPGKSSAIFIKICFHFDLEYLPQVFTNKFYKNIQNSR